MPVFPVYGARGCVESVAAAGPTPPGWTFSCANPPGRSPLCPEPQRHNLAISTFTVCVDLPRYT